ncbi:lysylphosphatidylglycerol synthase transmembrane domain-containing protein [Desulfobaculum sp.]
MKRWTGPILRTALTAGCIWYVARGLDVAELGRAMRDMAPMAVVVTLLAACVDYVGMGLRLRAVSGWRVGWVDAIHACVLCNGLNVILPARMGEAAKILYMRRQSDIPAGSGMGMVFWERFADLNMLVLFILAAAAASGRALAIAPVALVAAGLWGCLVLLRFFPALRTLVVRAVYFPRLRALAEDVLGQLNGHMRFGFLLLIGVLSLWPWVMHWVQHWLLLVWGAGLALSPGDVLAVFVISAGGLAIPSSPGNVGVYEAVMVAGLALFGVPREKALALALVCHMAFHIPLALYAFGLMTVHGLGPKALRTGAKAESEPESEFSEIALEKRNNA